MTSCELDEKVIMAEEERINLRRNEAIRWKMLDKNRDFILRGLALSGGGIRAAFIARGLIETLAAQKKLAAFDYISSVSGGGYAACMLTDHVGNLKKPPTFPSENYNYSAPHYRLLVMVCGATLDPLLNFFPLFSYLCLGLILPFSKNGKSQYIIAFAAIILFFAAMIFSFQMKRNIEKNLASFEKARSNRNISLNFFCFMATATVTIWISANLLILAILISMFCSGVFVESHPHRFYKSRNPVFQWLFIALLSVLAATTARYSNRHPFLIYVLFSGAIVSLLLPLRMRISAQNNLNLIFKEYRNVLSLKFIPFSKWLTNSIPFYKTGQSWNPYPIINATANLGPHLEAFELTPLFCGYGKHYFSTEQWLPNLKLGDAMAISGGAVDFLKKTATIRSLIGALIGGTDYWVTKDGKSDGPAMLSLERLLSVAGSKPLGAFRLSDGGFVENLGVISLIKRRVKIIVCLDAGYDPEYKFEDLRRLLISVQSQGLAVIDIPEMETASQARRFRQNNSNILRGKISYPASKYAPAETAIYIHLKISGTRCSMENKFPDFPHLTTLDQNLIPEEICALYELGKEMGEELCTSFTTEL